MAFATPIPLARAPARAACTSQRSVIRAAKHVQFKGAKKADRRRPKKHRPSDIHRAKPKFQVEPLRVEGLPEVFEVLKPDAADAAFAGTSTLIDEAMVKEYEASFVTSETVTSETVSSETAPSETVASETVASEIETTE